MAEPSEGKNLSIITGEIIVAALFVLIFLAIFGKYLDQIMEIYNRFLDWVYAVDWRNVNRKFLIIFTIINVGLIIFSLEIIKRYFEMKRKTEYPEVEAPAVMTPKEEVRENWNHVQELIQSPNPSDWNIAVLRADALLDDILIRRGLEGETMADRLKLLGPETLPSLEKVWSAHRLRNQIAHNPMEKQTKENLAYAIRSYQQALKELGLME